MMPNGTAASSANTCVLPRGSFGGTDPKPPAQAPSYRSRAVTRPAPPSRPAFPPRLPAVLILPIDTPAPATSAAPLASAALLASAAPL
jgi:hypothetical protein